MPFCYGWARLALPIGDRGQRAHQADQNKQLGYTNFLLLGEIVWPSGP